MLVTEEAKKKLIPNHVIIRTTMESERWIIRGRREGHSKGYMRFLIPNHPNAMKDGYVYEHIYIMTIHLGCGIPKGYTVHHIDGNVENNKISNLRFLTFSEHRKIHPPTPRTERPKCKICRKKIAYTSTTGFCFKHYIDNLRNNKKICSRKNCGSNAGFRSGLCLKHIREVHNKRRYRK